MPNQVTTLSDKQKAALEAVNATDLERISRRYFSSVYEDIEADIDAFLRYYENEEPTPDEAQNSRQFKRWMADTITLLTAFAAFMRVDFKGISRENIEMGMNDAAALIASMSGMLSISADPVTVSAGAIEQILAFLATDGPLYARLELLPGHNAALIAQGVYDGMVAGMNPEVLGKTIAKLYGMPLNDSIRMTRTVQIWSYREASRADYIANGLDQWVWFARLDGLTCMSCVNMHGSEHPVTESLNDHYSGRCVALPMMYGINPVTMAGDPTGEQWFSTLDEAQQEAMMGKGKYSLWKDGKFDLSQLTTTQADDVYGEMRTVASLKSLLEG